MRDLGTPVRYKKDHLIAGYIIDRSMSGGRGSYLVEIAPGRDFSAHCSEWEPLCIDCCEGVATRFADDPLCQSCEEEREQDREDAAVEWEEGRRDRWLIQTGQT